jgi:hypothetical protein
MTPQSLATVAGTISVTFNPAGATTPLSLTTSLNPGRSGGSLIVGYTAISFTSEIKDVKLRIAPIPVGQENTQLDQLNLSMTLISQWTQLGVYDDTATYPPNNNNSALVANPAPTRPILFTMEIVHTSGPSTTWYASLAPVP